MELTWNCGRVGPYNSGGRGTQLVFEVDDMGTARKPYEGIGCICLVSEHMGVYVVEGPDGCWLEIVPSK